VIHPPAASSLWDLPNVIVSPHSAPVSDGNDKRAADIFFGNIARRACKEALDNERSA